MAGTATAGGDGVIFRGFVRIVSLGVVSLVSVWGSIAASAGGPVASASGEGATAKAAPAATAPSARITPSTREALAKAIARREDWRRGREAALRDDFGETAHFRRANAALSPPAPGEKRVIFVGDSITAGWSLDRAFPGKGYINRGIGGQTTSQVLVRFRQDVIDLAPAAVVI